MKNNIINVQLGNKRNVIKETRNKNMMYLKRRSFSDEGKIEKRGRMILSKNIYLKRIMTNRDIWNWKEINKHRVNTGNALITEKKTYSNCNSHSSRNIKIKKKIKLIDTYSDISASTKNITNNNNRNLFTELPTLLRNPTLLKENTLPVKKNQTKRKVVKKTKILNPQFLFTALEFIHHKPKFEIVIKDFVGKTLKNPLATEYSQPDHTFFIEQNVLGIDNFYFFGLLEGKGKDGYHIACVAKSNFIYYFSSEFAYYSQTPHQHEKTTEYIHSKLTENNYQMIHSAFLKISHDIEISRYDLHSSGCSVVLFFSVGKKIIVATLGETKGLVMRISIEDGKENIIGDVNRDTEKSYGIDNKNSFIPFVNEFDVDKDNVKSVFICNNYLYNIITKRMLMKILCKGLLEDNTILSKREKLSEIGEKILTVYKEFCNRKKKIIEEGDFIIIYY